MGFFFDCFKRVFELVLNFEAIPGYNMLGIGLLVLTVFSVFRFLVFPLFTRESMSDVVDKVHGSYVDYKRKSRTVGFTNNNKKGRKK